MAICPECYAEIHYLFMYTRTERKYEMSLNPGNGRPEITYVTDYDVDEYLEYECPHCDCKLDLHSPEEAMRFLIGDVPVQTGVPI